jgi:hypothetical protein
MSSVTDAFGPLVVYEGTFDAQSKTQPWSAWWYPLNKTDLFKTADGTPAPLQVYDQYVSQVKHLQSPSAADYEANRLYDPNASSWEGLCNAWSAASLFEPEPTHAGQLGGITFSVGDLKALLLKTYEVVDGLKQFGQRYNGERGDDYEDIYPDQFHKFLQHELFEKRRPFIMDEDPGVAVWNMPVWKTTTSIAKDEHDPEVMHVDTWVFGASEFVNSVDYVGTLTVATEYTYDLYGYPRPDGAFHVVYGVWTGKSMDWHPDFVVELPEKPAHHSKNTALDNGIVSEIIKAAAANPAR